MMESFVLQPTYFLSEWHFVTPHLGTMVSVEDGTVALCQQARIITPQFLNWTTFRARKRTTIRKNAPVCGLSPSCFLYIETVQAAGGDLEDAWEYLYQER
jgi:hypothetical protein